jgi:hypothetical protein
MGVSRRVKSKSKKKKNVISRLAPESKSQNTLSAKQPKNSGIRYFCARHSALSLPAARKSQMPLSAI